MAHLVQIERKDRDSGLSEVWYSLDGQRGRLMMDTAVLDGDTGRETLKCMAMEQCRRTKQSAELGQLRIEE